MRGKRFNIDKNWLKRQYLVENKSIRDIARELGISRTPVFRSLQEAKIDTNARNVRNGMKHTNRTKRKMSISQKGRIFLEKTRHKMSIAAKARGTPSGKLAPNWQGGKSFEPYPPEFNKERKERVRNRDNRSCSLCGKGEIQVGRRMPIHHINGNKDDCSFSNLAAVCISCNVKAKGKNLDLYEFLISSNLQWRLSKKQAVL